MLQETRWHWPGLDLRCASDDIRRPTDWSIQEPRTVFVVHLGGRMDQLETELDGHGGSFGAATPGEVWSAPAGRRYASHARGGTIHYAELRVDGDALAGVCGLAKPAEGFAPVAGQRDDFLHHAVRQLIAAAEAPGHLARMAAEQLSRTIALHLWRTYIPASAPAPSQPSRTRLDASIVRRLRGFIADHLTEALTLDQLASVAGVSAHHLLPGFRAAFGQTPWQYIIGQRLRRACWLLTRTRHDITSIALDSGFFSHSHLTTTFRKRLGCAPSEFRASHWRGM